MIRTLHEGLLADGFAVPLTKLCAWLGVPRRTVYYKPVQSPPKIDPAFEAPVKKMIEQNPSFGYRTVAWLLGFNKNTVQRIFQLKGWPPLGGASLACRALGAQTTCRCSTTHRGAAVSGRSSQCTLVYRYGPRLGWQGRLGHAGAGHGLPHA